MRVKQWVTCAVGCGALLGTGCTGPMVDGTIFQPQPRRDPDLARIAADNQQMSVEFQRLSEQLTVLNRNQELLEARLARLEAQSVASPRQSDEIAALRRDMQLLRVERDSLRNEITSDLAARIEAIAARQQAELNAARTAAAAKSTSAAAAATEPARGSGYEHKVERGQTLSEIARGYGKSVESIMKANKITNPSHIRVGQILFIPD
ncbi:MAG TPA: LysM domain-containing protein [Kiritimatiellia bacterium]|nr:LysM domain-containing protein [Kiritimatiellia bacterium]HRU69601.1 LysM domain-containing protein [Kiritimatiellia bacterium]